MPELLEMVAAQGNVSRLATSRDWPAKRQDILSRVEAVLGPEPRERPPLEPQFAAREDLGKFTRQWVSYQVEPGERCAAWLLVPQPMGYRRPAVVCCHQTTPVGKDEPAGLGGASSLHYAQELARLGYVCLAPDCITAGERIYPDADPYETAPFYARHPEWSALGKMLWDHRRALDFLCSLDCVDQDRLGVIGHSLGGENALMLGAFDHRIKVTAASCAYTPFAVDPNPERWCRDSWFVYLPQLQKTIGQGLHPPFRWVEILALITPRALHYTYALEDEVFPHSAAIADDMMQLGRLYDLMGSRRYLGYYEQEGGHGYTRPARQAAYKYLAMVLQTSSQQA